MTDRFAVIGNPIAHSLSPAIHQFFAQEMNLDLIYERIMGDKQDFEQQVLDFFSSGGKGLNITMPFKQKAFEMASIKTSRCSLAGAANTLWMKENQLHADNTDGIGLIRDLNRYVTLHGKNILVLGAGGAARGIIKSLLEAKPSYLVVANRTFENAQALRASFPEIICFGLDDLTGAFDLVINATSASLEGQSVHLPAECLATIPWCYDLAYKQNEPTAFVHYARSLGCGAVDGLGMLVEQAAEAFYVWHGVMPVTKAVLKVLRS